MRINEKGRSMIEMLGVLAIIGVLSVGGIAGYSKAMAKFKANKTIDLVSHTVANTRILFGSQRDYGDLGTDWGTDTDVQDMALNAKLFPDEVIRGGKKKDDGTWEKRPTFDNAYAGHVGLYASHRLDSTDDKAFVIVLTGVPQSACIDLATQDWAASSGSGFVAMKVEGVDGDSVSIDPTLDQTIDAATLNGCEKSDSVGASMICAKDGEPMTTLSATKGCSGVNFNNMYFKFF